MLKLNPRLAILKRAGWELAFWWQRHNPDADHSYSPGPFLGPESEITAAREEGYIVTLLPRPDGCDRPSIQAPNVYAVAARWPRLVAAMMATSCITPDEAAWVLWMYLKGMTGTMFGRTYVVIVRDAACLYFDRTRDGNRLADPTMNGYYRKSAKETLHLVYEFIAQNKNQK